MSRLEIVICRIDDESQPERRTELDRIEVPEPDARSRAIRRATWRMRSASARDEPPYFWTTKRDMAPIIPKDAGTARSGRSPAGGVHQVPLTAVGGTTAPPAARLAGRPVQRPHRTTAEGAA